MGPGDIAERDWLTSSSRIIHSWPTPEFPDRTVLTIHGGRQTSTRPAAARSDGACRRRPARPFIHLRVHSAYSLLEGALPLSKVVAHAAKDSAPAIAVTDTNNLFGALEFAQKAVKEGVQPIIGCQLDFSFPDNREEGSRSNARRHGPALFPLVLIAANEAGYRNLVRLVSRAYLENPPGEAVHLPLAILDGFADGIICLTGGPRGPIGRALKGDHPAAGRGAAAGAAGPVRRPALCRDRAARRLRPGARSGDHRPRLPARFAAGRHQRGLLPDARGFRRA